MKRSEVSHRSASLQGTYEVNEGYLFLIDFRLAMEQRIKIFADPSKQQLEHQANYRSYSMKVRAGDTVRHVPPPPHISQNCMQNTLFSLHRCRCLLVWGIFERFECLLRLLLYYG